MALVARRADRLAAGVAALKAKGISAAGFPADAGDPAAIRGAVAAARAELGPIAAIHWNAYSGSGMGDLLSVDPVALGRGRRHRRRRPAQRGAGSHHCPT